MFTSSAQKIFSKTTESLEIRLFGRSSDQNATLENAKIDEKSLPDGFSIIDTTSSPQNSNLWMTLQRVKDIALGKLESIDLYAVVDGKISALVKENVGITDILRLNLGNYSSFALVRDSGLRNKVEELGNVILSGLMPKNGTAEAVDVTDEYADFVGGLGVGENREADEEQGGLGGSKEGEAVEDQGGEGSGKQGETVRTIAAYDISIINDGEEYQPEDKPIEVTIKDEAIQAAVAAGKTLSLWHVKDDGSKEQISDFTITGDTVTFSASGFSVYVLTETIYTYYKTASGETYKISVEYDSTAKLPQNAALAVSEILPEDQDYDSYIFQSITKLSVKEEAVTLSRVFDIKIVDENGVEREPAAPVKVSIQLVGESLADYASVDVVHFGDKIDEMDVDLAGDTVEFTTDSFSVYVVDGTVHLRQITFFSLDEYLDYVEYPVYMADGTPVYTQYVKSGDAPVIPQTPVNPQDPDATFAGWYLGEMHESTPVLATDPYDFNTPVDDDEAINLYAKFKNYYYVVFHGQYDDETGSFPVAYTRRAELVQNTATIKITDLSVPFEGYTDNTDPSNPITYTTKQMVFTGWSDTSIETPGAMLNDQGSPVEEITTDSEGNITITAITHLYPIFAHVDWITYYSGPSGSNATYISDVYYLGGEGPTSLPGKNDVSRSGYYDFQGWYASTEGNLVTLDADGEVVSGGVQIADENGTLMDNAIATNVTVDTDSGNNYLKLTGDVILYAKWQERTTATYTVIIRRQKATDNGTMTDAQKSYEFAERFELEGAIDATVSLDTLNADYKDLETLASYNNAHPNETISSDDENSYKGYDYNATASARFNETNLTIAANGGTTLIVCYDWLDWTTTPDKANHDYTLKFIDSQDTSITIPFVDENSVSYDTQTLRYGISLTCSDKSDIYHFLNRILL